MYYYAPDKKPLGPVTIERLHELFRRGIIGEDTRIIRQGESRWTTYRAEWRPMPLTPARAVTQQTAPLVSIDRRFTAGTLPHSDYGGMVKAGWVLLGVTALLACIPVLGFAAWIAGGTIAMVTVVLAIIIISRGGTRDGLILLLVTIFVFPLFILLGPLASTLSAAAAANAVSKPGEDPLSNFPFGANKTYHSDTTGQARPSPVRNSLNLLPHATPWPK